MLVHHFNPCAEELECDKVREISMSSLMVLSDLKGTSVAMYLGGILLEMLMW